MDTVHMHTYRQNICIQTIHISKLKIEREEERRKERKNQEKKEGKKEKEEGREEGRMDGSGLRLEPGSRFNTERGAKAQSGAEVRPQLEKGLRLGLGLSLAWHVEDFLPVVLVFLRHWPVLLGIQTCSSWGGS